MPASYEDSYERLKQARKELFGLSAEATREERYARLRIAFYHVYQAVNMALRCYESGCFEGGACRGGVLEHMRDEAGVFLHMSTHCHEMIGLGSWDALRDEFDRWALRAKAFVDHAKADETRRTNIEYARIPEFQDISLITKQGAHLDPTTPYVRRGDSRGSNMRG